MILSIDINFDFCSDTPNYPKNDPDKDSPTLRQYHKTLWSKPLPDGTLFSLTDTQRYAYLYHKSGRGAFYLSSDTMSQPYRRHSSMQKVRSEVDAGLLSRFRDVMYVMGNMIIFPGIRENGRNCMSVGWRQRDNEVQAIPASIHHPRNPAEVRRFPQDQTRIRGQLDWAARWLNW